MRLIGIGLLCAVGLIVFSLYKKYRRDLQSLSDEELDREIQTAIRFFDPVDGLLAEKARRANLNK